MFLSGSSSPPCRSPATRRCLRARLLSSLVVDPLPALRIPHLRSTSSRVGSEPLARGWSRRMTLGSGHFRRGLRIELAICSFGKSRFVLVLLFGQWSGSDRRRHCLPFRNCDFGAFCHPTRHVADAMTLATQGPSWSVWTCDRAPPFEIGCPGPVCRSESA